MNVLSVKPDKPTSTGVFPSETLARPVFWLQNTFGTMEASSWDSPLSGVSQTKMDKKRLVYGEESQPRAPTALV